MQNTDAMLAFYRGLGFEIRETAAACSVYVGSQMINFHRPALWQSATFTLRPPWTLAGRVVHAARTSGNAAVWRSLLCVGWHARGAEILARRRESRRRRGPGSAPGRP
jgi:hypothetical protein